MKRHEIFTNKGWKGHGEKSYRKKAGSNSRIKYYFNNHLTRSGLSSVMELRETRLGMGISSVMPIVLQREAHHG